jgi:hypothetical protein
LFDRIIPGHGRLSKVPGLRRFHQMLTETTGYVREQLAAGVSLARIKQQGLPAEWRHGVRQGGGVD